MHPSRPGMCHASQVQYLSFIQYIRFNMTNQEIRQKTDNIAILLERKQLKNAFEAIRELIELSGEWAFREQLDLAETTYKYMLQYMLDGVVDPERDKVYNDLLKTACDLAGKVILSLNEKKDPRFYYQNRRAQALCGTPSCAALCDSIYEVTGKISLSGLLPEGSSGEVALQMRKQLETLSIQLFQKIWLSSALGKDESSEIRNLIRDRLTPRPTQCLAVSALTLSLKEFFDDEKLLLLFDACESEEEEIRQRALIGIILTLYACDRRISLYPHISHRLTLLLDNPSIIRNIHSIIHHFILTRETEKISKKISEEVIPEMMKISPKPGQKIKLVDLTDDAGMNEKNPDWQNMLDETGLTDKLQEINDLQMEGVDVMHSSFSNLKTHPFFQETANWFLPFSAEHSSLTDGLDSYMAEFVNVIGDMEYMCNSDKYSFCFSLMQIPESYRNMMPSQTLSDMDEAIRQEREGKLIPDDQQAENISKQYILDLYRFYKVHPRKADFEDIFATPLAIHKTQSIGQFISDAKSLMSIGEYYFNRNQLKDAKDIFMQLAQQESIANALIFQKIGYCEQMEGNMEAALAAYLKSDLIASGNSWTLKKIAHCYRMLKNPEEALAYYQKAEALNPDNLSVLLNIGHCYLELKKYKEALKSYFKVEYLNSTGTKSWRPIAWCSFLTGKYEQAAQYYEKILNDQPEMTDYINFGHTLLAMKDSKKAIELYGLSIGAPRGSKEKFIKIFNEDIPELVHAGIEAGDIPIIIDQALYRMEMTGKS
jgi:tetratricopeptide (TPR) repeat protein